MALIMFLVLLVVEIADIFHYLMLIVTILLLGLFSFEASGDHSECLT